MFAKAFIALPAAATFLAALDVNQTIALGALLVTVVLGPRYLKVRAMQAEIAGLKSAIDTRDKVIDGDDKRIRQLESDLAGAQARANASEKDAHEWRGRHDAIKPYTAEPAFHRLEGLIAEMTHENRETNNLIRRLAGEMAVNPPEPRG